MTFDWGAPLLRIFGAKRANESLQLLRSSSIHQKDYLTLSNLAKQAMSGVILLIHPHRGTWVFCVRKSRVRPYFDRNDSIATANVLRNHDVDAPWDLARAHKPRIGCLARSTARTTNLHIL